MSETETEADDAGAARPKVRPVPHPFEPDPLTPGLGTANDPADTPSPQRIAESPPEE